MKKIEIFYKKVNGGIFYFVGVAVSIVSIIISVALYVSGGASYSILNNYVSDLGRINSPNNAFIAFNTGLIISSIISPFGAIFLFLFLQTKDPTQKRIILYWLLVNIIYSITTFLVGLFPEDTMKWQHASAALATFITGFLSYLLYGIIALRADNIARYHSIPGFIVALISIVFLIVFFSNVNESISTFFEWMILFGGWGFGIYLGIFCLKAK
ncbi:MAG: DUF998 domain-containing protein [Candidatus Hodarchaeota archaeon]